MPFVSWCLNVISSAVKVNPVFSLTDRSNQIAETTFALILSDIINLEKYFYSLNIDFSCHIETRGMFV